ncbi:Lrp/AsnC family transcriptional regulator [Ruania alkalisoli]|uniref:Lrp/AsnC family transcriptional regulator n=1 Tax=Ruania alkalisoli TaxID=2779775 RepID=A0A7M1SRY4_9MICO|nr:Lrp/AsnC family transcriptional regulator [Ruania alkalisoli]QOR70329.1 Lrp/AsnC family transcriptional regulator [Ruania alkalisoli]
MVETDTLELLDQKVVAALLAHPRCRMSALAAAAGTSAPTVSRRLNSLFERKLIRVVSVIDQQRAGYGFAVFLRLRCIPGASADVAQAVAQWPESGYVSVVGGDLDCTAQLHVRSTKHLMELLNSRLTQVRGVTGSSTSKIIRRFSTPHGWSGGLVPEATLATLRAERLDHWSEDRPCDARPIDALDQALVDLLSADGRRSWRDLAEHLQIQPATARRRVEALMSAGLLRLRAVVQPAVIGQPVVASLWLRVTPARLEAVGRTLAAHPNVLNIAATTGLTNLSGEIATSDDDALYTFLTEEVGRLPGVAAVDVSDGLQVIKRASLVYDPEHPERVRSEVTPG